MEALTTSASTEPARFEPSPLERRLLKLGPTKIAIIAGVVSVTLSQAIGFAAMYLLDRPPVAYLISGVMALVVPLVIAPTVTYTSFRFLRDRAAAHEALERALGEVRTLRGLLPICANCKNIRDEEGRWHRVEAYVSRRTEARFSHGVCPDCLVKLYPEEADPS